MSGIEAFFANCRGRAVLSNNYPPIYREALAATEALLAGQPAESTTPNSADTTENPVEAPCAPTLSGADLFKPIIQAMTVVESLE